MTAREKRQGAMMTSVAKRTNGIKAKVQRVTNSYILRRLESGERGEGAKIEVKIAPNAVIDPKTAAKVLGALGVVMKPQEDYLIALLDEGNLDEFRRRLNANKLERRKQMFARVINDR